MHSLLRQTYGLVTTREEVRKMIKEVYPSGVENRRAKRMRRRTYRCKGPNSIWHIDGYDKLKSYGLAIHGAIDGFSRRVIWLECAYSNNDPAIIAHYFLEAVQGLGHCPQKIRSDCGTETANVAAIQCVIVGSEDAYAYGTSPSNQRIESFWSFFRKSFAQSWIDIFEDMEADGLLTLSNKQDIETLRFCFMDVFRRHLHEEASRWNLHRICRSRGAICPAGRPEELYFLPNEDYIDCKVVVGENYLENCRGLVSVPSTCANADYESYLNHVCSLKSWKKPSTWKQSMELYLKMRACVPDARQWI